MLLNNSITTKDGSSAAQVYNDKNTDINNNVGNRPLLLFIFQKTSLICHFPL